MEPMSCSSMMGCSSAINLRNCNSPWLHPLPSMNGSFASCLILINVVLRAATNSLDDWENRSRVKCAVGALSETTLQ